MLTVSCSKAPAAYTTYEWSLNGSLVQTTSTSSWSTTAAAAPGVSTYSVVAKRGAIRSAAKSIAVTVTTNTPPNATSVSWPSNASSFAPNAYSTIGLSASDPNSNLSAVDVYVNGGLAQHITSGTWSNLSVPYSFATPGVYVITATATDFNGATSIASATVTVLNDAGVTVPNINNAVAGSIAGTAAVSPSGAAVYAIPIQVPPGTAAVMPQLSLSYSSEAGDGPLGVGWTLNGLSRSRDAVRHRA